MSGVLWLVPVALVMGLAGLAAFIWSLGAGQHDDPDGNAARILAGEDRPAAPRSEQSSGTNSTTPCPRDNQKISGRGEMETAAFRVADCGHFHGTVSHRNPGVASAGKLDR